MSNRYVAILVIALTVSSLFILYVMTPQFFGQGEKLVIFHAGSLNVPMSKLEAIFESNYSNVDVVREASGSVMAARKVLDLGKKADIIAVADYQIIKQLLIKNNLANWYIGFATNKMVIVYTEQSKYASEINATNWFKILLRKDVTWGHSDPELDPAGYRTLLVWKLAELYYNEPGLYETMISSSNIVVRPKSVDLISLIESGQIDYAFEYESVALQHNLPYVQLPDKINLGNFTLADYYAQVSLKLENGMEIVGEPIIYGVTILKNSENYGYAVSFLDLMLSHIGREVFTENHQEYLGTYLTNNIDAIPGELRNYPYRLYSQYGSATFPLNQYSKPEVSIVKIIEVTGNIGYGIIRVKHRE